MFIPCRPRRPQKIRRLVEEDTGTAFIVCRDNMTWELGMIEVTVTGN